MSVVEKPTIEFIKFCISNLESEFYNCSGALPVESIIRILEIKYKAGVNSTFTPQKEGSLFSAPSISVIPATETIPSTPSSLQNPPGLTKIEPTEEPVHETKETKESKESKTVSKQQSSYRQLFGEGVYSYSVDDISQIVVRGHTFEEYMDFVYDYVPKDERHKKIPFIGYYSFSRSVYASLKKEYPELDDFEINAYHIKPMWKRLSNQEKIRHARNDMENKLTRKLENPTFYEKKKNIPKKVQSLGFDAFRHENYRRIKNENPDLNHIDLCHAVNREWQLLPENEKQKYRSKSSQDDSA